MSSAPRDSDIAILLCAGYGTRMGALTRERAKPLLPVAGRPLLDHLMGQVATLEGITHIHVVTNHRYAAGFHRWAETWRPRLERPGQAITIHDDGSTENANRLGGAGDLGFVLGRIELPEHALVSGTDNIFRFALDPLWQAFLSGGENWLLGVKESDTDALRRSGVLELGPRDIVLRVHEKPAEPQSPWSCPSLYCLRRSALRKVLDHLEHAESRDDLGILVNYLIRKEPFRAFKVTGQRLHVGSRETLEEADRILRSAPVVLDTH